MKRTNVSPPKDQPSWMTNIIFSALGGLIVLFWGGLIWLGLTALMAA